MQSFIALEMMSKLLVMSRFVLSSCSAFFVAMKMIAEISCLDISSASFSVIFLLVMVHDMGWSYIKVMYGLELGISYHGINFISRYFSM